ncbi:MAG: YcaO-like family protein [Rhodobacterales bacterium]|nr:YcaO-like family protein [Rhodobacterales bacterium]
MKLNPAETIVQIGRALEPDFTVMPLHAPGAPLFLAIALPAEDGVTGLKPRLPAGRGMTTGQAMIAAGAEALELRASLAQSHLAEIQALPRRDGLAMVAATDLLSQAQVPVPAQTVYLDCAALLSEPLQVDADSTGCAVGPDHDSALDAALWECVERDAVALWWHGIRPAAALPLELIDTHQPRLFWWLHQRPRKTLLLDLTTDIGLPVVVAVGSDADGRLVATGAAARPLLADAALAALTEMVQTEVSIGLAREAGDPEVLDWIDRGSTHRQSQFQPLAVPRAEAAPMGRAALLDRLASLGHRALAVDLTLPGDPMPSVRVLVPGLCAMRGRTATERFARLCPGVSHLDLPEPY